MARPVRGSKMPKESNSKARIFTVAGVKMLIDGIFAHLRKYMVTI